MSIVFPASGKRTGVLATTAKGFGFVAFSDPETNLPEEENLFIPPPFLNHALHGDTVEVELLPPKPGGDRQAGKVLRIITPGERTYIGTLDYKTKLGFVKVPGSKLYVDIVVYPENLHQAKDLDKVAVEITGWPESKKNPVGKITKVFGPTGNHEAEMQAILASYSIEAGFPSEVEAAAEHSVATYGAFTDEEIKSRLDLRELPTFTIDPDTAKDFDDAISFVDLGEGRYQIGVHIADVSHFVRPETALDEEAYRRSFSTYLVDRTIPMLPEVLSNEYCSLNPHVDRYAFSALFELDLSGNIYNRKFGKSIIHSDKRFTYEEAQAVIEAGGEYEAELRILNTIAKAMSATNKAKGSIEFETDEIKFELDKNGFPIRVIRKVRFDAHKLVEEFMLLANREVARFMSEFNEKHDIEGGFVYRTHELPDRERMEKVIEMVRGLGYALPSEDGAVTGNSLNALFEKIEGKPEEGLIKTAALRAMAKALYTTSNNGHFGLAFEYYTHFTSPIRRYADLCVHRLLFSALQGKVPTVNELAFYQEMTKHVSEQELSVVAAERDSIKYKQVQFMEQYIGQTREGTITGVSEWGIYIEDNDTRSEGLVRFKEVENETFVLDEKNYQVFAEKSKKRYRLGDTVSFVVKAARPLEKQLDFSITS